MSRPDLPDFRRPPVTEVALSVQFDELESFHAVHLGLLWQAFGKESFPRPEEHSPIPPSLERFGIPEPPSSPQIQLVNVPPMPRCIFISGDGTEVIQIQNDRFTYNWRKRTERDTYPRFEVLANHFDRYAEIFAQFVRENKLGTITVSQAEVTYVNRIDLAEASGQVEKIVSVYSGAFSDGFLHDPEDVHIALRFPMRRDGELIGRLYVDLRPAVAGVPASPRNMTLLARGRPQTSDIKDVRNFFEIARQYIVSGFASVTSEEMHKVWERTDNA